MIKYRPSINDIDDFNPIYKINYTITSPDIALLDYYKDDLKAYSNIPIGNCLWRVPLISKFVSSNYSKLDADVK